jgi:hypothetical protein
VRSQNAGRNDVQFGQDDIAALKPRVIPVAMTKDAPILEHPIRGEDARKGMWRTENGQTYGVAGQGNQMSAHDLDSEWKGLATTVGKASAHRDRLGVTDTPGPVSSSPARSGDAHPLVGWCLSQALSIMHSSSRLPLHIRTTVGRHEDEAPTAPHS